MASERAVSEALLLLRRPPGSVADVGLVLILGLVVALPVWYLVGVLYGGWVGRRYHVGVPSILDAVRTLTTTGTPLDDVTAVVVERTGAAA